MGGECTVRKTEVFEVDVGSWVEFSSRLHECINKIVILLASSSWFSEPEIQVIIEKLFIIGTAIEDNWQSSVRMDSSTERCENQFGDRDEDSSYALIPDPEDLFSV